MHYRDSRLVCAGNLARSILFHTVSSPENKHVNNLSTKIGPSRALLELLQSEKERNQRVSKLFRFASHNACVQLFDEIDALGKQRGNPLDVGELDRIVIGLTSNESYRTLAGLVRSAVSVLDYAKAQSPTFQRTEETAIPNTSLQLGSEYGSKSAKGVPSPLALL